LQTACWLIACLGLTLSATVPARDTRCRDTTVVVSGWTAVEAAHICASVSTAFDWLHTMGISVSDALVIHPLLDRAGVEQGRALGRYDAQTRSIHLLPFETALQASNEGSPACGVPMTLRLWHGYVAHEAAHAAIEPHFAFGRPKRTASEYIAAVTQLTTLPPATRGHILAAYADLPAWGSRTEITSVYYFLDPCAFAVKSYRHFTALSPTEQPLFIARLLREGLPN